MVRGYVTLFKILQYMETQLKKLLEELAFKQQAAKSIHDREATPVGNVRMREASWGKFVAYSHCIKQIDKILNNETYPVLEDAQRSEADSTHGEASNH